MWWIRVKKTGQILQLRSRGTYGYFSRSRVITALKSSCFLHENGMLFSELQLINRLGLSIEHMTTYPVSAGYALRHAEGWYWMHPGSHRVWYARPGDVEGRWNQNEEQYAIAEGRQVRHRPDSAGFEMVCGFTNGDTTVKANWY